MKVIHNRMTICSGGVHYKRWPIDLFTYAAPILNSIVSNSYYGMLLGRGAGGGGGNIYKIFPWGLLKIFIKKKNFENHPIWKKGPKI